MQKKKLKLDQLKVTSLVTSTASEEDKATIKGGQVVMYTGGVCTATNPIACRTVLPIYCNLKTANCTQTHFPNCVQLG